MADTELGNETSVKEFILLGFGKLPELKIFLFLLFLLIYIVTLAGNILIAALVVADQHLHTPMYFFLGILSCLEICYSSTILPRELASLLTGDRTISVSGCFVQYYFFSGLAAAECYLLSVMSFDRYLAICKPLHYGTVMNSKFCLQLAAGSCIIAFVVVTILICLMSQLTFCGPSKIDHFFCDFTPVVQLSCGDTYLIELVAFCFASIDIFPPFLLTLTSYIYIIANIIRIPSTIGKQRAFSTCSSHLIVVTTLLRDPHHGVCRTKDTYTEKPEQSVLCLLHSPDSNGEPCHLQPEKQRGQGGFEEISQ
ncbi:olfactory receptor 6N1-like [Mauremys mutica]|uniref:olfactory receptor 6N1-like n=1 Tax=Mauremys mutica TaxID=74926 RepID=UPI001D165C51|nr:olfactory receptor 6N1-like [Mauremys mutica]